MAAPGSSRTAASSSRVFNPSLQAAPRQAMRDQGVYGVAACRACISDCFSSLLRAPAASPENAFCRTVSTPMISVRRRGGLSRWVLRRGGGKVQTTPLRPRESRNSFLHLRPKRRRDTITCCTAASLIFSSSTSQAGQASRSAHLGA